MTVEWTRGFDGTWWYDPDERLRQQVRDEAYARLVASVPHRNYVREYNEHTTESAFEWYMRKSYEADMRAFCRRVDAELSAWLDAA
jgi:hypothetical protein